MIEYEKKNYTAGWGNLVPVPGSMQQSDNSGSTTEKPEDIPAIDNDEDVAYPGADVVEIVNPRGDKTTVYKLADGTYMDREERPFTYNGTDTWTDENGTEWNEVAKD